MKIVNTFLIIIALFVINCSSASKTISSGASAGTSGDTSSIISAEGSNDISADYETRIYEVFGMDCPGCESGLGKLVNKIEAVHSSASSWKNKRLVIKVKPGHTLNDKEIFKAISDANFTVGKRIKN